MLKNHPHAISSRELCIYVVVSEISGLNSELADSANCILDGGACKEVGSEVQASIGIIITTGLFQEWFGDGPSVELCSDPGIKEVYQAEKVS